MTAQLIRKIHVGCRQLGIDADTRHDMQLALVGKASLADMTARELQVVLDGLVARGFKPSAGKTPRRAAARRGDVRYLHVLWRLLAEAKAVDQPGAAGLNGFVRRRFAAAWGAAPLDVDLMQDWQQIATVAEALKAMCRRAGIAVEK